MPLLITIARRFLHLNFLMELAVVVVVAGLEITLDVRPWTAMPAFFDSKVPQVQVSQMHL